MIKCEILFNPCVFHHQKPTIGSFYKFHLGHYCWLILWDEKFVWKNIRFVYFKIKRGDGTLSDIFGISIAFAPSQYILCLNVFVLFLKCVYTPWIISVVNAIKTCLVSICFGLSKLQLSLISMLCVGQLRCNPIQWCHEDKLRVLGSFRWEDAWGWGGAVDAEPRGCQRMHQLRSFCQVSHGLLKETWFQSPLWCYLIRCYVDSLHLLVFLLQVIGTTRKS